MNFYFLKRRYNAGALHKTLLVMKLITIFLTTAIMQVSAGSFAQRITLNTKNTTLKSVIDQIHQQSGYDFIYNNFDLQGATPVSIHLNKVELEKSIEICLAGQDLDFEIKDKTIILKKREKNLLDKLSEVIAPAGLIKGSVIDANGVGLPGAVIRDKNRKTTTFTNTKGEFAINVEDGTVLVVSFLGFKTQEVAVRKGANNLIITMEEEVSKLDEVSVEGYRKGSQRLATSNISRITAEELDKQPVQNPLQALEGHIPGMVVSQSTGVPGARLNIEIRGRSNFDNFLSTDQPLFIIDGVPTAAGNDKVNVQSGPFGPATTNGLTAFAGLNTADIESIDVLKDADATAIYGSRGANGVILITTKKGKAGKMVLSANVYSGISTATYLTPLLNTQQYVAMRNEAFANDKLTKSNSNAYDLLLWDQNRYTDFEKLLIGNKARSTDAQVNISGGSLSTTYRIATGYHKETTVWPGDKSSDRLSTSFNLNTRSQDEKFTAALTGNYSVSNSDLVAGDLASAAILPPNYRLYDANGNLAWNEGGLYDGKDNPLALLKQQYASAMYNLNANLVLNYRLLQNLTLRSSFGYNSTQNNEQRVIPIASQNPMKPGGATGTSGFGNSFFRNVIAEPQIEYNGHVNKGKLNVLLGTTYNQLNTSTQSISALGYNSDDLIGSLRAATSISATNSSSQYNYQAVFGRVNYNWEDKYIINFTGRRDGSSRFGPDFRFSNFGAAGAAWVFSNEEFLKNNKIVSYGKLRASYGTTGNDQIGNYTYLDSWSAASNYTDSTTLLPTKLYNPYLHWERNSKLEFGLEMGFFKDRVLFTASAYQSITSDPLVTYPLPKITGFASIIQNLEGVRVQNRGLEFTLTTKNFNGGSFKWSTDFNLTVPQNILKQYPDIQNTAYSTRYILGKSLTEIFSAQYNGVDPATGLYTVKDVNGDKIASSADYADYGNYDPKFYGGITNSFNYKRFNMSFFVQFTKQLGRNWRQSGAVLSPAGTANNAPTLVLGRWQNPGDITDVQKFTTSAGSLTGLSGYYAGYFSNLFYVTDASYARLKNVYLSYDVPSKWLNKVHIRSFRVYMQGQNLFVITPYKGADPETQSFTLMPPLRTITAGLQLSL